MVSFNDASQFAEWAGLKIPNSYQWLAASVVDWSHVYADVGTAYREAVGRARILHHGHEWTSSLATETNPGLNVFELGGHSRTMTRDKRPDDVTVRFGPVYALFEGWREIPFEMRAPRGFFSERIGFRVIR
jgi:hypothetical protein